MNAQSFIDAIEDAKIVAAITQAENKTSAEIRVFVSQSPVDDPLSAARVHFQKMGMFKTAGRNAVLIFVAPPSRNLAIVGDIAVDQKCGLSFWNSVSTRLGLHFKAGDYTKGLVEAIATLGELLMTHFPHQADDRDELSNAVERG